MMINVGINPDNSPIVLLTNVKVPYIETLEQCHYAGKQLNIKYHCRKEMK